MDIYIYTVLGVSIHVPFYANDNCVTRDTFHIFFSFLLDKVNYQVLQ